MKFCFKCGAPLRGTEKFCPKCGQKLVPVTRPAEDGRQAAAVSSQNAGRTSEEEIGKKRECSLHGIIFTDIKALAEMLGSDRKTVTGLLEQYSDLMADSDIDYSLVDVSDYTFRSKGAGRKGDRASFTRTSPWWDYQQVLYDIICYEKENRLPESNYLFIIGGHEVIPVATINHYLAGDPDFEDCDKDIETDILYSYPYGPHTQYSLESAEIYKQEMYFLPGRLPIPAGSDISYLVNYLQNAINCRNGLPVKKIYAQTDPHWKNLTAWLMEPYNKAGMLPDRSNISGKYSYGNVMLGPDITSEHIRAVMDTDTDFIYLNLHGSNNPASPGYAGEYPTNTCHYASIFPVSAMEIPETCNVFIAEACYGGRFIGYDTMHSMIQAGLAHKTVIGMASSRIAFGGFDAPGGNADTICGLFTAYLLGGYRAADAFVMARKAFFREDGMLNPYEAATLAEFNLYGDPTLRAAAVGSDGSKVMKTGMQIAPKDFPTGYKMETIKSTDGEASLLDRIRSAVDANIQAISAGIGEHLYKNYGLPPREPQTIKKIRYANGQQRLIYTYKNNDSSWVVTSTPDGKVETVMTSK